LLGQAGQALMICCLGTGRNGSTTQRLDGAIFSASNAALMQAQVRAAAQMPAPANCQ
jgi:hypothetical protein